MNENEEPGAQQYIERKTEEYAAAIPAAVRTAILENIADLADSVAPERNPRDPDDEDALDWQAWDAAIAEYTDRLKSSLPTASEPRNRPSVTPQPTRLDPLPYYCAPNGPSCRHRQKLAPSTHFAPRTGYSQARSDYEGVSA